MKSKFIHDCTSTLYNNLPSAIFIEKMKLK